MDFEGFPCDFMSRAGAAAFFSGLKSNQSLSQLIMELNPIGPAGAAALVEVLQQHPVLQFLDRTAFLRASMKLK